MGLRELKKQRTRQAIAETAFELFAARGFDHVTVAEVADAADVSEKTVFNYFPTKEDLLFDEIAEREAALVDTVRNRRPGESVPAAFRRRQLQECMRLSSPGFAKFAQIIDDSPALRARELEIMARFVEILADTLQGELDLDELEAQTAASLLVGVQWQFFRLARERALSGHHGPGAARRLRADLRRSYAMLERGLAELG